MITILPVTGLPEIGPDDDVAALIAERARLVDGDVVAVAQKIISKAEAAFLPLHGADPTTARRRLAREHATAVVAEAPWALIVRTAHGFVCANAGIDASNVEGGVLLALPDDPDLSARRLRDDLRARTGAQVAVVVTDTFGRPWRLGQTDVAIGLAGFAPLRDERGGHDRQGRRLEMTETAVADELAGAADLVRRKADGIPVVIIRGLKLAVDENAAASELVRPLGLDLFARGRGGLAALLAAGGHVPAERGIDDAGVDAEALTRAVAAARAVTGADVTVEARDQGELLVTAPDPVAAGAAAGIIVAVLHDLGYAATLGRTDHGAVLVICGPAPPPPSASSQEATTP